MHAFSRSEKIRAFYLLLGLAMSLALPNAVVAYDNAEASINDPTEASPLKIAKPKKYKSIANKKLGRNENQKGLEKGTQVETLLLSTAEGNTFNLADAWRDKPALIVFFRGGWCPYCNFQVREMALEYERFENANVQPVLISVDAADQSLALKKKYEVPFPVLSDPELLAHSAFNVVLKLSDDEVGKLKIYGINPSRWSERAHQSIAVSSAFIVDTNGKVLLSHAPSNYRYRPSVDQLVGFMQRVNAEN